MQNNLITFETVFGPGRIGTQEKLSNYTSLKIGGAATYFIRVQNSQELVKTILNARKYSLSYRIIGGGTNILVADTGYAGLVIKNDSQQIRLNGIYGSKMMKAGQLAHHGINEEVYLEVESGVNTNRLVRYSLDQGLSGLEYFLGHPGTIGGAICSKAYNRQYKIFFNDVIAGGKILNENGMVEQVTPEYFLLAESSDFYLRHDVVVLSVVLKLKPTDKSSVWEKAQHVSAMRQFAQPQNGNSLGYIFRDISVSDAMRIATPDYITSPDYLLEQVGLRGYGFGNAEFDRDKVNFILNKGAAKASDVIELISVAKEKVISKFNVKLVESINKIGKF